jgi:hypothetical protein
MTTGNSGAGGVAALKEQIKVRGLNVRSGFKTTPLNHIKGTLTDWDAYNEPATQAGWSDRVMVRLQFDSNDLEVIASDSPYTMPNAAIELPYNENGIRADGQGNGWAFFAKSAERLIPEGEGLDSLKGQHLELQWRDTFYDEEDQVIECRVWGGPTAPNTTKLQQGWIVVGANGSSWGGGDPNAPTSVGSLSSEGLDPAQVILDAIDGKDKNDANTALMGIDAVRASRMADVMSGVIYDELVAAGTLTLGDDGVYHKV